VKVELIRYGLGWNSTLGKLLIDGKFTCYTVEDEYRSLKVKGETCIPDGAYQLELRRHGAMNAKYAALYPRMHRGMIHIRDIPDFEYVQFHRGNSERDSAGCPIVGTWPVCIEGEFEVRESAKAYELMYPIIAETLVSGRNVTLEVKRRTW
jgi:hypothetical protein